MSPKLECGSYGLTRLLRYLPGHVHAFYLLWVYFERREHRTGGALQERAPGIYSDNVQRGGATEYGTVDT